MVIHFIADFINLKGCIRRSNDFGTGFTMLNKKYTQGNLKIKLFLRTYIYLCIYHTHDGSFTILISLYYVNI